MVKATFFDSNFSNENDSSVKRINSRASDSESLPDDLKRINSRQSDNSAPTLNQPRVNLFNLIEKNVQQRSDTNSLENVDLDVISSSLATYVEDG